MEHLQVMALQGAEEVVHQLGVIEMERVLAVMALEEIPVQQGSAVRCQTPVKLHQLR